MILYGNNKLFLRVEAAKEIEKVRRDWVINLFFPLFKFPFRSLPKIAQRRKSKTHGSDTNTLSLSVLCLKA